MVVSSGRVFQISVNPKGGVPKQAVLMARLHATGVEGDKQRHLQFHGGPDRAVCLFSLEQIRELQREGHPIGPGTTGENLTLEGIPWSELVPGARLRVGAALLEVAGYTSPCKQIRGSFEDGDFTRISQKLHAGWSRVYARVLQEAVVHVGDPVSLVREAA